MNLRSRNITVDALNRLAECSRDANVGYNVAARSATSPLLRAELSQYAMQREQFAHQLREAAQAMGETISEVVSFDSPPQRAWSEITPSSAQSDEAAILRACARAEIATLRCYDAIDLLVCPEWLRQLILTQHSAIERVLDRIRSLQHALAVSGARRAEEQRLKPDAQSASAINGEANRN
jgi:uncharacterized protein (TIGR02284 family)